MCRHLSFEKQCEDINATLHGDTPAPERGLRFDNCLVLCDEIWKDFIRPPAAKGAVRPPKGRSVLGNNLVPEERVQGMVQKRHAARVKSDIPLLSRIYEDLAKDVDVVLKRAVLTDFVTSPQYKEWLALKFPIIDKRSDEGPDDDQSERRPSIAAALRRS